jgi:hypothetical protein
MPYRLALVGLLLAVGCGSQAGEGESSSAGTGGESGGAAAHGGATGAHSGAGGLAGSPSDEAGSAGAAGEASSAGEGGAPPELGGSGGVGGVDSVEAGATGEVQAGAAGAGVATGALFSRCSDVSECGDGLLCAPEGRCAFRCGVPAFPKPWENADPNLSNVCEQAGGTCVAIYDSRMWCYSSAEG